VTDDGLALLEGLDSLWELQLLWNGVTDDAIEFLSKLKKLRRLDLRGTKVTDDGVQAIREALPDLHMYKP
jgi:hypothetical protein